DGAVRGAGVVAPVPAVIAPPPRAVIAADHPATVGPARGAGRGSVPQHRPAFTRIIGASPAAPGPGHGLDGEGGASMLETAMDLQLLHRAASAYYVDGVRQAEVAERLGVSRPTVSKLLAEARRIGMVRFEVLEPPTADLPDLAARLQDVLGVRSVRIAPGNQVQRDYRGIGDLLGEELRSLDLQRGEVLLISSGKTTYAVSGMPGLPELPGVVIAPTVGGQQETDPSFQTNEIVRRFADRTRAEPKFMFAPASPSEQLWESLQADPSFREITDLWARARAVVVGIGEPYQGRAALTSVVPRDEPALVPAVGDINLHF